jgi:hypothetical protein
MTKPVGHLNPLIESSGRRSRAYDQMRNPPSQESRRRPPSISIHPFSFRIALKTGPYEIVAHRCMLAI